MKAILTASLYALSMVAGACAYEPREATHAGIPGAEDAGAPRVQVPVEASRRSEARDVESFGPGPEIPQGPHSPELAQAVDDVFGQGLLDGEWGQDQARSWVVISESGDPRLAWVAADLLRFTQDPTMHRLLSELCGDLLGLTGRTALAWDSITDHLIAWDVPAPPGYLDLKRGIFTRIVPEWEELMSEGDIDWRHVTWGGVRIDDRAFGQTDERCNCIPAADNPEVTGVEGAGWLADDDVVFGIEVGGEFRAYPRQIMEVREMVNDTLGGRDLGIPYCTLCGSAQAYFTDRMPEGVARPVLRTSGLLVRSNKVMYDLVTNSIFDTFLGKAVTGPLAERGIQLPQASVVTTTWGEWRAAHPSTTVLAEYLALGRDFDFRAGRDANGPIFPIGDLDPRLAVQEDVLGLLTASGKPVAFHVDSALEALHRGASVAYENIVLVLDAGGVRATDADGRDLGGHQAFWFAWSQFHPSTALWAHGSVE